MLIDTHAHFAAGDGADGYAATLPRALAAGVTQVIAIGGNPDLNAGALAAAEAFPAAVRVALGWDRDQVPALTATAEALAQGLLALEQLVGRHRARVVALGEMGLDYHYSPESALSQRTVFTAQLALARRLALPVVVHSRDADADTVDLLAAHVAAAGSGGAGGVLHCFTGTEAFARRLLELGFHISFSGIVTFRNADPLRAVARRIPAERLLIETDTPYLAPVPVRGRRNEPAFVRHVAEEVARARGCALAEVARITTANARQLFRLP